MDLKLIISCGVIIRWCYEHVTSSSSFVHCSWTNPLIRLFVVNFHKIHWMWSEIVSSGCDQVILVHNACNVIARIIHRCDLHGRKKFEKVQTLRTEAGNKFWFSFPVLPSSTVWSPDRIAQRYRYRRIWTSSNLQPHKLHYWIRPHRHRLSAWSLASYSSKHSSSDRNIRLVSYKQIHPHLQSRRWVHAPQPLKTAFVPLPLVTQTTSAVFSNPI